MWEIWQALFDFTSFDASLCAGDAKDKIAFITKQLLTHYVITISYTV